MSALSADTEWMTGAACLGSDTEDFFPERADAPVPDECNGCPVRLQCRDYAMRHHITYGIWGGMTAEDRIRLRRRRATRRQAARKAAA